MNMSLIKKKFCSKRLRWQTVTVVFNLGQNSEMKRGQVPTKKNQQNKSYFKYARLLIMSWFHYKLILLLLKFCSLRRVEPTPPLPNQKIVRCQGMIKCFLWWFIWEWGERVHWTKINIACKNYFQHWKYTYTCTATLNYWCKVR